MPRVIITILRTVLSPLRRVVWGPVEEWPITAARGKLRFVRRGAIGFGVTMAIVFAATRFLSTRNWPWSNRSHGDALVQIGLLFGLWLVGGVITAWLTWNHQQRRHGVPGS